VFVIRSVVIIFVTMSQTRRSRARTPVLDQHGGNESRTTV